MHVWCVRACVCISDMYVGMHMRVYMCACGVLVCMCSVCVYMCVVCLYVCACVVYVCGICVYNVYIYIHVCGVCMHVGVVLVSGVFLCRKLLQWEKMKLRAEGRGQEGTGRC